MCYSAQVQNAYDEYCKVFGADIDIETFARLYGMKLGDSNCSMAMVPETAVSDSI